MNSITEIAEFCQKQAAFHQIQARRYKGKGDKGAKHLSLAETFETIASFLSDRSTASSLVAPTDIEQLFVIDPYDVSDLPSELVAELSIPKSDADEVKLVQLLRLAGRPLSLNEILVGIYRKHGDVPKRTQLNARLYRLTKKGDLVSHATGVYAIPEANTPSQLIPPLWLMDEEEDLC